MQTRSLLNLSLLCYESISHAYSSPSLSHPCSTSAPFLFSAVCPALIPPSVVQSPQLREGFLTSCNTFGKSPEGNKFSQVLRACRTSFAVECGAFACCFSNLLCVRHFPYHLSNSGQILGPLFSWGQIHSLPGSQRVARLISWVLFPCSPSPPVFGPVISATFITLGLTQENGAFINSGCQEHKNTEQ